MSDDAAEVDPVRRRAGRCGKSKGKGQIRSDEVDVDKFDGEDPDRQAMNRTDNQPMRIRPDILPRLAATTAALVAAAGCVTTDANGKPIAREVRTKLIAQDQATAEATLDGSRIVAMGKPAIAFLYPGVGWVSVRDLDAKSIIFSGENAGIKTLYTVTTDGTLTGAASKGADGGTLVTEIAAVNKTHTFAITYRADGLTGANSQ